MDSALIVFVSSRDGGGIEQAIASERKSRGCEERRVGEAHCFLRCGKNKAACGGI
jgi:hypothetical protein